MNTNVQNYPKLNVINDNKYVIFLLRCLGVDIFSKKRTKTDISSIIFAYFVPLVHHFACAERAATFIHLTIKVPKLMKVFLAVTFHYISLIIAWNAVNFKKRKIGLTLKILQKNLEKLRLHKYRRGRQYFPVFAKIMTIILCIFPFPYGVAYKILISRKPTHNFLEWKLDKNSFIAKAYYFLVGFTSSALRETFCGAVSFLYSLVCWRLCYSFQNYRLFLENTLKKNRNQKIPKAFFSNYVLLLDAAEEVDASFKTPIFFITVFHCFSLFGNMALAIETYRTGIVLSSVLLHVITTLITTCIFLTINVMMSAQVHIEVERNVHLFFTLNEEIIKEPPKFRMNNTQMKLLQIIKSRNDLTFSGCNIIYFYRNLLLMLLGTLITYGLLIMNF